MKNILFIRNQKDKKYVKQKDRFKIVSLIENEYLNRLNQKKIEKICLKKLHKIKRYNPKRQLANNLKIDSYNKSFWPFIESFFYHITILSYIPNLLSLYEIINEIEIIKLIIKEEKPKSVTIPRCDDSKIQLIKDVCKKKGIVIKEYKCETSSIDMFLKKIMYNTTSIKTILKLNSSINIFSHYFRKITKRNNTNKYDIIILSGKKYQVEGKDTLFYSIAKKFTKEDISYSYINYSSVDEVMSKQTIIDLFSKNTKEMKDYYDFSTYKKSKELTKEMQKKWIKLIQNNKFKKEINYNNINIYKYLEKNLIAINKIIIPYASETISITKKMLEIEKPKVALLETEVNYNAKGIIFNSEKLDTKTIAFQFGLIIDMICDQTTSSEPKPNIKIVGGEFQKMLLVRDHDYSKKQIKNLGEPRYDYLLNMKINFNKLMKELGLNKNYKTILFTSQNLIEWTDDIINHFYELLQANKNIQIIIKPHPSERDIKKFKKFAKRNSKVICINKKYDTSKLIKLCDVLVTFWSTTSFEALLCKKPVVLINFNKKYPEYMPFVEEGSALGVNRREDLVENVEKALYDTKTRKKLKKGIKRSLKIHAESTDGKVFERVHRLVKGML